MEGEQRAGFLMLHKFVDCAAAGGGAFGQAEAIGRDRRREIYVGALGKSGINLDLKTLTRVKYIEVIDAIVSCFSQ